MKKTLQINLSYETYKNINSKDAEDRYIGGEALSNYKLLDTIKTKDSKLISYQSFTIGPFTGFMPFCENLVYKTFYKGNMYNNFSKGSLPRLMGRYGVDCIELVGSLKTRKKIIIENQNVMFVGSNEYNFYRNTKNIGVRIKNDKNKLIDQEGIIYGQLIGEQQNLEEIYIILDEQKIVEDNFELKLIRKDILNKADKVNLRCLECARKCKYEKNTAKESKAISKALVNCQEANVIYENMELVFRGLKALSQNYLYKEIEEYSNVVKNLNEELSKSMFSIKENNTEVTSII